MKNNLSNFRNIIISNWKFAAEEYDNMSPEQQAQDDRVRAEDHKRRDIQHAAFERMIKSGMDPYTARDAAAHAANVAIITLEPDDLKPRFMSEKATEQWSGLWKEAFKK